MAARSLAPATIHSTDEMKLSRSVAAASDAFDARNTIVQRMSAGATIRRLHAALLIASSVMPSALAHADGTCPSPPELDTWREVVARVDLRAICAGAPPTSPCERLRNMAIADLTASDLDAARALAAVPKSPTTESGSLLSWLVPVVPEASLIAGFAQQIASRAEEEAQSALRERIAAQLCAPSAAARCLFPDVCQLLVSSTVGISLNAAPQALRSAASRDLLDLPYRLVAQLTDELPGRAQSLALLLWAREARRGAAPLGVLRALHRLEVLEGCASAACRADWSTVRRASAFLDVLMDHGGHALGGPTGMDTLLVLSTVVEAERALGGAQAFDVGTVQRLASAAASTMELWRRPGGPAPLELLAAISSLYNAAGEGCNSKCRSQRSRLLSSVATVATSSNTPDVAWAALDVVEALTGRPVASAGLIGFVGFAVELTRAQTSDGIVRVLDSALAPVGGYRAKYSYPSLAVGAFVGATASAEFLIGADSPPSLSTGATVPVGLHASWPVDGHHLGIFASVADLGAFTQFRVASEEAPTASSRTAQVPIIEPAQLLSPGLFFVWGPWELPLAVAVGATLTPAAREVTQTVAGASSREYPVAVRAGAFIAVDVTLLRL